jgi:rhamnosyltransferase
MVDALMALYPTVSIVIPTYQGGAHLPDTLAAIRAQEYPNTVEIVAVDSESTDNTRELLLTFGAQVIPITQQQFTHGYSRNLGVQHATGEVIVFMSQDALPAGSQWLQTLVTPLADPTLGATYARQIARPNATPLEEYFHLALYPPESKRYRLTPDQHEAAALRDIFFSNVCSAARREICLKFPFDLQIIMSEDQVFARALLKAGYATSYNAETVVIHSHPYDLQTLFRRNFDSAYSLIGVSSDGFWATAQQGIAYIAHETTYIIQQRRWLWLLAIPPYELMRIAGRLLGARADRLPKSWRRAFSLHRGYWSRPVSPGN